MVLRNRTAYFPSVHFFQQQTQFYLFPPLYVFPFTFYFNLDLFLFVFEFVIV